MKFIATSSLAASAATLVMLLAAGPSAAPAGPLHRAMLQPTSGGADFTVTVTPANATITSGQSVAFQIILTSRGLAGTINVGLSSVSPQTAHEPAFRQPRYDIWVPKNGTGGTKITFSASDITVKTTYTYTLKAQDVTGGPNYGLTHTTTFMLSVT